MASILKKLTIEGFKSIRKLEDFPLRDLNVLIGPNGAGKSNFVGFFRLLHEMIEQRLQVTLAQSEGGADGCLFMGPKITERFVGKLYFGNDRYEFTLVPTSDNRLVFSDEKTVFFGNSTDRSPLGSGHFEAKLKDHRSDAGKPGTATGAPCDLFEAISSWVVYHFHDTGLAASVRRPREINQNERLGQNAENLAPFLYRIHRTNPAHYSRIRDVVRLAAPFFDDFNLRPNPISPGMVQLEWRQKDSDYLFQPNQLSDGTLRFICLATALLQPSPPATILFDEPELGLHPYALTLLGNLFKQATQLSERQIIVSTQSAQLLNEFEPEDIIVVARANGQSTFRRLTRAELSEWLEDYTLGELWLKNVLGGRPRDDRILEPVEEGDQKH